MARPNVFISYSHKDQRILRNLLPYLESLQRQNFAEIWSDTELKGGDRWREEIEAALNSATVAVLLISQSFIASRFIYEEELPRILRRQSEGKLTVLPVYLSPSTVKSASISFIDNNRIERAVTLSDFQGFGTPDRTIKELPRTERDRRFLELHNRIKDLAASAAPTALATVAVKPTQVTRSPAAGSPVELFPQAKEPAVSAVASLESDESRRFAGEIEKLNSCLEPIKSDSRIYDLLKKGFFGRAWLFEAVEKWRQTSQRDSRLFWITGDPGAGKSAFAAQLTHTRSDAVIAAQFVEWDKPDHRDAGRVVRSLAFQLATRLADYRKLLLTLSEIQKLDRKGPAELFDYLLVNPLRSVIHGRRERYLIVIDALDEAGETGRNPLVEILAHNAPRLPDWIGLVVTSRPEGAVKTPLQGLNPFVLETRTEANRADIRAYLRHELASPLNDRSDADGIVERILEKSEGMFLYAERVCEDLQQHHLSLDRLDQFPQGLGGIFCQFFQRQFPDLEKFRKEVRPALRAILAAREPLPVEILQSLFAWQDEDLRDFTRGLGSLFPLTNVAAAEVIKPYHKSVADWLADEKRAGVYFVSVLEGHRLLGEFCFLQWKNGPLFAIREVVHHLQFAATPEKLLTVLLAPAYYEDKLTKCGLAELLEDLNSFSVSPLDMSAQVTLDECLPEVKAVFAIAALIVFSKGVPAWRVESENFALPLSSWRVNAGSARILRRFVEGGCDPQFLETEREKLKPRISRAEREPRSRREETHRYGASTAHLLKDYIEYWLRAEDAAFALKPAQMIAFIGTALRYYAIWSCDGDPNGAIRPAIEETAEDLNARLPVLQGVALRLNAGIAKLRGRKGISA